MAELIEKLKKRWGVTTWGQLVLILFIFSITGMSALYAKKFLFGLMGISAQTAPWLRITAWLLTVFPAYQVLFLFYGFIFGQFEFVWRFEKKSLNRIKSIFAKSE